MGKTRFLREVIHRFRDAGGYVLEGGCVQVGTDGLPYGPLIEALRGLSSDSSEPDLDALLDPGRAELARLMPHLEHEGEGALTQGPLDGSAQGRLFEHLLLLFGRLAAQRPLMVAMEDIHWADRSTLDLLAFLARNLRQARVIVLVTYRTDELDRSHPLLPFLASKHDAVVSSELDLSRFERSEDPRSRALRSSEIALTRRSPRPSGSARKAMRSSSRSCWRRRRRPAVFPTRSGTSCSPGSRA